MQIRTGKTRIVILIQDKAIKFGRFRLLRLLVRLLSFPFTSRRNHESFHNAYGEFPEALWNYVTIGLTANKAEYAYYQDTGDSRVVPTVKKIAKGWIVIQRRGAEVSAEELLMENPFLGLAVHQEHLEIDGPWQFCRIKGKVVLADYGRKETCITLRQTLGLTTLSTR